jgi:diguanylate cyclase (GGDEF)-like protein
MRAIAILALVVGIALLAGSIGLAVHDSGAREKAADGALVHVAEGEASQLQEYFGRARTINLITAHNPAFSDFYAESGPRASTILAQGRAARNAEDALAYLERLYPASIGEVCFIDRSGAENGRYVRGVRARFADLSLNERTNPFFAPTFALDAGQVFQAKPYVSPDTHEWVISNSTPVPPAGTPAAAIVHFEITLESFRRAAEAIAGDADVVIIDADTGAVIVDSRVVQRVGAPLGRPDDRRFASVVARGRDAGVATVDGRRAAFQRLADTPNNANHWIVVASDAVPAASFLATIGWAPAGIAFAAVVLLALAAITFRNSRRVLYDAAHTDPLTGLQNRRQLVLDLDSACQQAPAEGCRFALALFDLDGFKGYNDSFGHLPGDALLRRLAQKLALVAGDRSSAYRLGGDEFCMLTRLQAEETADDAARQGAEALSEEGEGFAIGASYGCVVLPDEAHTSADALAIADLRMYARKNASRPSAGRQTTDVLVRVQSERYPALGPHVSEVGQLATAIGERLGLSARQLRLLRQAAELHDVGKIAIPDAVLDKPGKLTEDEWALMREHTVIGERILAAAPALHDVAGIVRASHERFDGHGYPDGLAGEQIPLEARIINAADAVCAMTSDRPYHTARSYEGALDELRRCSGGQFDPVVVDVLIRTVSERPRSSDAVSS